VPVPSGPLGPSDVTGLTTRLLLATLEHLELKLWLNGNARQSAPSRRILITNRPRRYAFGELLELRAGGGGSQEEDVTMRGIGRRSTMADVILTGTPGVSIAQGSPKLFDILKNTTARRYPSA